MDLLELEHSTCKPIKSGHAWPAVYCVRVRIRLNRDSHGIRPGPQAAALDVSQGKRPENPNWDIGSTASPGLAGGPQSLVRTCPRSIHRGWRCQSDAQCCHSEHSCVGPFMPHRCPLRGPAGAHQHSSAPGLMWLAKQGQKEPPPTSTHHLGFCSQPKNIQGSNLAYETRGSFT